MHVEHRSTCSDVDDRQAVPPIESCQSVAVAIERQPTGGRWIRPNRLEAGPIGKAEKSNAPRPANRQRPAVGAPGDVRGLRLVWRACDRFPRWVFANLNFGREVG